MINATHSISGKWFRVIHFFYADPRCRQTALIEEDPSLLQMIRDPSQKLILVLLTDSMRHGHVVLEDRWRFWNILTCLMCVTLVARQQMVTCLRWGTILDLQHIKRHGLKICVDDNDDNRKNTVRWTEQRIHDTIQETWQNAEADQRVVRASGQFGKRHGTAWTWNGQKLMYVCHSPWVVHGNWTWDREIYL